MSNLVKAITPLVMSTHVKEVEQDILLIGRRIRQKYNNYIIIRDLTSEAVYIPAFSIQFKNNPFWDFLQHGLRSQSPEIRIISAKCLGDILLYSTKESLSPMLTRQIMGILIRVIGDRFTNEFKIELLDAISKLLDKGDSTIFKTFIPQLNATIIKSLEDKFGGVRKHALLTLNKLTKISNKNEVFIKDMKTHIAASTDINITESLYRAARITYLTPELTISPEIAESFTHDLLNQLSDINECIRRLTSSIIGISLSLCKEEYQISTLSTLCVCNNNDNALLGRCMTIKSLAHHNQLLSLNNINVIIPFIKYSLQNDNVSVRQSISEAIFCLVTAIKHQENKKSSVYLILFLVDKFNMGIITIYGR